MTATTRAVPLPALLYVAEKLRARSDGLTKMACQIEETDEAGANALYEAAQHLDDAAYILEELKLA